MALRGLSYSAVLLDALGTLVELEPPAERLRAGLTERFGLEVSESQAERAIGAEIAYYRAHLDEGRDRSSLAALRRRCAEALWDALPDTDAAPATNEIVDVLLASLRFRLYADAAPTLEILRDAGVSVLVVSNWDVSLHGLLGGLGLTRWVDGVLTSAEVGARKPARAMFERALAVAQVGAERVLHVGDSLEEDVAGARAAGLQPVLLMRRAGRSPAPRGLIAIRTLRQLPALVSGAGFSS